MSIDMRFLKLLINVVLIWVIRIVSCTDNLEIIYRLPNNTIPIHYNINLTLHLEESNFTFYGESNVNIKIHHALSQISLHSRELKINETATTLINEEGIVYKPMEHTYDTVKNILILNFDDVLLPGFYTLNMKFAGNLFDVSTLKTGFMKFSYVNKEINSSWLAATYLEPDGARQIFPCWDEPALKATFDISVIHDKKYKIFSNMPIREVFLELNDTMRIHFYTTPIMSTYLVAIVAIFRSDYVTIIEENEKNGTINTLYRPSLTSQVTFAHSIAKKVLPLMIQYTNNSEKVPKMDQILIPNYPSVGMENWGLIIYKETSVIYDDDMNTIYKKKKIAFVIAHEIIHQWFGNLVTPSWWHYLWLSEGFASFFQEYIINKIFEDWRVMDLFVVETLHYCLTVDNGLMRTVTLTLENALETESLFSVVVYKKAPVLLRMLYNTITDEIFRKGVITYLATHQFSSTTPDDLWNAMQSALDESDIPNKNYSIKEVMDTWMNQRRYPMVNVMRNYETGEVTLSQECFRAQETTECTNNTWWIPITFATLSNPDFSNTVPRYWLRPHQNISFNIDPNDWIILNVQQIGYYRVNYDMRNWHKISSYLSAGKYRNIHILNRAQIVSDSYVFLVEENKEMNGFLFINLISYLALETDYVAWYPMFRAIEKLSKSFFLPNSRNVKMRIIDLFDRLIQNVGYEENLYDDDITKLKRLELLKWACIIGHEGCKRAATIKLSEYLANPNAHKIPALWEEFVYCSGLMTANKSTWDKMWELYQETSNKTLLKSLSCVEDPEIIIHYLNITALNPSFSKLDYFLVFRYILEKHMSNNLVFDYILENFDILKPRPLVTTVVVNLILSNVYSIEQIDKIKNFLESNMNQDPKALTLIQQIEERTNFIKNSVDTFEKQFYSKHPLYDQLTINSTN